MEFRYRLYGYLHCPSDNPLPEELFHAPTGSKYTHHLFNMGFKKHYVVPAIAQVVSIHRQVAIMSILTSLFTLYGVHGKYYYHSMFKLLTLTLMVFIVKDIILLLWKQLKLTNINSFNADEIVFSKYDLTNIDFIASKTYLLLSINHNPEQIPTNKQRTDNNIQT